MEDITVTPPGIGKILKGLNPAEAAGPDGLSPRVLKELGYELASLLTVIFQRLLDTG